VRSSRIENVVLDVPWFRGAFEMKADSRLALALMQGHFEDDAPTLLSCLVQPGEDAVDVGANIGLFSVYLASLVGSSGRVLAIEPSPAILPSLRGNLQRNNARNVVVHEGLVAETDGEREFHSVDRSPEYSSMGAIVHPHAPKEVSTLRVRATTLDALVGRHGFRPSFVKIDVEGAEGLVLEGARETLRIFRPAVLSEVDDRLLGTLGYTSSRVFRAFEELEYRIFDLADGGACVSSKSGVFVGGVLALPEECCELA
jgi:FkbM family methyltransferase